MTIFHVMLVMAICGHMAILGHMATYGHNQHDMKYSHDGYPWKEHEKYSSPVKELSDLGVWFKSYGQNKNFELFLYVRLI